MDEQEITAKRKNLKKELRKEIIKTLFLHGTGNMTVDFTELFSSAVDVILYFLTLFSNNKEEAYKTVLKIIDSVKEVYTKIGKEEGYDLENL